MKTQKISESEISTLKVSSLPTRPTAPTSYGGRGYTSLEMKMAFDLLPLFIIERYNALIDELSGGEYLGEALLGEEKLTSVIEGLKSRLDALEKKIQ